MRSEAALIGEEIAELRRNRRPGDCSMAVLYRQHMQREDLMAELAARDIPFIVIGLNVLETAMARDVLALAGAVGNDNDADSLFRVCALPKFNVVADELAKKAERSLGTEKL